MTDTIKCSWQKWHQMNRMNLSRQGLITAMWAWGWLRTSLSASCVMGVSSWPVSCGMCGVPLADLSFLGGQHSSTVRFPREVVLGEGRLICPDHLRPTHSQVPRLPHIQLTAWICSPSAYGGPALCLVSCWALDVRQEEQRSRRFSSWPCGLPASLTFSIPLFHHSSSW